MRLAELIETLRANRSSAEECARRLTAGATSLTGTEAARGFRTAFAVAAIDTAFGRRLAEALEHLAAPPDAVISPPDLVAWEEELRAREAADSGARAAAAEAARLQEEIARGTQELVELTAGITSIQAEAAASHNRCQVFRALLAEVDFAS